MAYVVRTNNHWWRRTSESKRYTFNTERFGPGTDKWRLFAIHLKNHTRNSGFYPYSSRISHFFGHGQHCLGAFFARYRMLCEEIRRTWIPTRKIFLKAPAIHQAMWSEVPLIENHCSKDLADLRNDRLQLKIPKKIENTRLRQRSV